MLDEDGNVIPEAEIEANMSSGYRTVVTVVGGVLMGIPAGMLIIGKVFIYGVIEMDKGTAVVGAIALEGGGIFLGYQIGKEYDRQRAINRTKAQRRQRKEQSNSEALLRIESGDLCFAVPSLTFRPVMLSEDEGAWEYQVRLVSARF